MGSPAVSTRTSENGLRHESGRGMVRMAFHDRVYDAYVILGDAGEAPVWSSSRWRDVAQSLDELLGSAEGPVAVRSSQLEGPTGRMKPVAFGRMGWNEKGHAAWTHDPSRVFGSTEVWAPGWAR